MSCPFCPICHPGAWLSLPTATHTHPPVLPPACRHLQFMSSLNGAHADVVGQATQQGLADVAQQFTSLFDFSN